jgi:hypothetical protein
MDECEQVVFETSVTKAVAFLEPELTAASARAARRGPTPSTCAACGPPLGIGVGQGLWWPACPCGVPAVAVRVAMVCAREGGGGEEKQLNEMWSLSMGPAAPCQRSPTGWRARRRRW